MAPSRALARRAASVDGWGAADGILLAVRRRGLHAARYWEEMTSSEPAILGTRVTSRDRTSPLACGPRVTVSLRHDLLKRGTPARPDSSAVFAVVEGVRKVQLGCHTATRAHADDQPPAKVGIVESKVAERKVE
jgi:hypothetical protein